MTASFADHVALLDQGLSRRQEIVERIESQLLNARAKEALRGRGREHIDQVLSACVFEAPGLPWDLVRLKGQLAARHLADGFEPLLLEQYPNELDPLELIARAHVHWEQTRWPGRSGRLTYAQTIYTVVMLRHLEHLSLTIWDDGNDLASTRLHSIQELLDRLNAFAVPSVLVRDARWLIHTAQGPVTRHLEPYFTIADRISRSFTASERLGLHQAGAKLAGGHLRSQLQYRARETRRSIDDPATLAVTRNSNSMDGALLVRDLVPLLEAYALACEKPDEGTRLDLADAILQGVSADPELLLTRLDLLTPCTMLEELFIERGDDGHARYTRWGTAHVALLERYRELIGQWAGSLREDAAAFNPAPCAYSPFGIAYGFASDLLANMALATLAAQPSSGLGLEDTFASRGDLDAKLARAQAWAALPKRAGERDHFSHSTEAAAESMVRTMAALAVRARHRARPNASTLPDARLFVVPASVSAESPPSEFLPAGIAPADEHVVTSDWQRALSSGLTGAPKSQILNDRKEGRFLASVESGGKWLGISKFVLTMLTSQGKDALITDVPAPAVEVLRLTCPGLIVVPTDFVG